MGIGEYTNAEVPDTDSQIEFCINSVQGCDEFALCTQCQKDFEFALALPIDASLVWIH